MHSGFFGRRGHIFSIFFIRNKHFPDPGRLRVITTCAVVITRVIFSRLYTYTYIRNQYAVFIVFKTNVHAQHTLHEVIFAENRVSFIKFNHIECVPLIDAV